jgi:hypothetical protein
MAKKDTQIAAGALVVSIVALLTSQIRPLHEYIDKA